MKRLVSVSVGWVDFFGGWLHQVANRKFYFGDDFISHWIFRIPWPFWTTNQDDSWFECHFSVFFGSRCSHGIDLSDLYVLWGGEMPPWRWKDLQMDLYLQRSAECVLLTAGRFLLQMIHMRYVVWVRHPSPVTLAKRRFFWESPRLNIHSNPGVVVITGRGPHPRLKSDIVYGLLLLFNCDTLWQGPRFPSIHGWSTYPPT